MNDNSDYPTIDLNVILWLVRPNLYRTFGGGRQLSAAFQILSLSVKSNYLYQEKASIRGSAVHLSGSLSVYNWV